MKEQKLSTFLKRLQEHRGKSDSFNPWAEYDELYDFAPDAPKIRLSHLTDYLSNRITKAKYILVAEAVGYQGAKFSGVPLTSERILLGHQSEIAVANIISIPSPIRTSYKEAAPSKAVQSKGYAEPTATIVWQLLQQLPLSTYEVILWNIFPFHPFKPEKGRLTNRTPRMDELSVGMEYLTELLNLCPPNVKMIAIGEKAAATIGNDCPKVRHPANAGATLFRRQLPALI